MTDPRTAVAALWNRSVFAQTSIVLCGVLLGAQAIAFWLFCGERAATLREAAKAGFVDAMGLSADALPTLPAGNAERFLWLSNERPDALPTADAPPELLARLAPGGFAPPWPVGTARANASAVGSGELDWWPAGPTGVELAPHPSGAGYVASLELGNGERLNGLFATPAWTSPLASQNWTLHAVTLALMVLASVLLSRRLTDPMRRFADAADRVGRGRRATLPAGGPSEVRRTAEAFDAMQRRILALVEDRTHLLSAIGHDLRTPLTSARLRAHLVDETRLRAKLLGDLDRLEAITESALDVVRGLAEEPAVRIELHALLGEIAADRREAGGDASLAPVDAPLLVACRPVMLRRAVTNLVDNAVRHGGGVAELSVRREASGEIAIRVRDRGAGIDEARLEEAFEPVPAARGLALARDGRHGARADPRALRGTTPRRGRDPRAG